MVICRVTPSRGSQPILFAGLPHLPCPHVSTLVLVALSCTCSHMCSGHCTVQGDAHGTSALQRLLSKKLEHINALAMGADRTVAARVGCLSCTRVAPTTAVALHSLAELLGFNTHTSSCTYVCRHIYAASDACTQQTHMQLQGQLPVHTYQTLLLASAAAQ